MAPYPRLLIANALGGLILLAALVGLICVGFSVDPRLGWALICVAAAPLGWRLANSGNAEVTS